MHEVFTPHCQKKRTKTLVDAHVYFSNSKFLHWNALNFRSLLHIFDMFIIFIKPFWLRTCSVFVFLFLFSLFILFIWGHLTCKAFLRSIKWWLVLLKLNIILMCDNWTCRELRYFQEELKKNNFRLKFSLKIEEI